MLSCPLQDHNCVRELRSMVQQQQNRLSDLQMDVSEIRVQYTELRRELRTVRVHACRLLVIEYSDFESAVKNVE